MNIVRNNLTPNPEEDILQHFSPKGDD